MRPQKNGAGFPDLCIAGPGGVLFRELKSNGGVMKPDQTVWRYTLLSSGADWALWTPADWPEKICHELDGLELL